MTLALYPAHLIAISLVLKTSCLHIYYIDFMYQLKLTQKDVSLHLIANIFLSEIVISLIQHEKFFGCW